MRKCLSCTYSEHELYHHRVCKRILECKTGHVCQCSIANNYFVCIVSVHKTPFSMPTNISQVITGGRELTQFYICLLFTGLKLDVKWKTLCHALTPKYSTSWELSSVTRISVSVVEKEGILLVWPTLVITRSIIKRHITNMLSTVMNKYRI